ncbi:hypothetical protein ATANTOWER_006080 [Ataeniobius toweri]|uniref:Uncharacterized protein n=1 Tax=Ataeniobius toweri TaxID=208326 RepID=A0ABU7B7W4_9TELE|nr:hypothetical protein [Ataeniobius toweri]
MPQLCSWQGCWKLQERFGFPLCHISEYSGSVPFEDWHVTRLLKRPKVFSLKSRQTQDGWWGCSVILSFRCDSDHATL